MAEPVTEMCDQLIKAVNVIMDPESSQRYRLEALKVTLAHIHGPARYHLLLRLTFLDG